MFGFSFITDSQNSGHEDANTRFDITFILKPKHAFNFLRKNMVNIGNSVLDNDDLFFGGTSNKEPFLVVFWFKYIEIISNYELSRVLGH